MARILVFGAGGQLGQCFQELANSRQLTDIHFLQQSAADILNVDSLHQVFDQFKPVFVINCAAYTAVDLAEDEVDQATAVNKQGAINLANACLAANATLVHISTDFVFAGNSVILHTENDLANPLNVYGLTKLAGEVEIQAILPQHYIIRTSWLYSQFANNFVKTMLKLATTKNEISVVADQIGSPTYAMDLADAVLQMIAAGEEHYGVYHYSNEGACSWYDLAVSTFELAGLDVKVHPIPSSAYPTKAKRPSFSVLDKRKIKATFNLEIPHWRSSLARCIEKINPAKA